MDLMAQRLRLLDDRTALLGIVEGLGDRWVYWARQTMGKDTRQLWNRTGIVHLSASASRADVFLEADTPYAGHHNYGNRYTAPNRFWNTGRDAAEQRARELDGIIESQILRSLTSGGSWNPRALI